MRAQPAPEPFPLPRVGDVVDPVERRYFGLFPDLDGEDTLRVERGAADSVRFVAASPGRPPAVRVQFSGTEAAVLADLLARYETLFLTPDSSFEAFRVSGLVRWRAPYQSAETWTTLALRSGPDVRGVLLYADEDGLVLSAVPFSSQGFRGPEDLVWVRATDVLRVRREGFWSRLDLRPAGDSGRYLRGTLPTLRERATFVRGLPPELEAWRRAQADLGGVDAGGDDSRPPARDYARLPLSRWRVGVQYGRGQIDAGQTTARFFGGGGPFTEDWNGGATGYQGRADYAVTPALGVGLAVGRAETGEIAGVGLDRRRFSATAVDLTVSYSVLPPQLRAAFLPSVTVRAGGSVAWTAAETTLGYYWPSRDYTATAEYSERRVAAGVAAGVEAAFRLSRGASVLLGYDLAVYPGMNEGARELDDPRVNLVIKTVEPRGFALRRGSATVGVAVHLGWL